MYCIQKLSIVYLVHFDILKEFFKQDEFLALRPWAPFSHLRLVIMTHSFLITDHHALSWQYYKEGPIIKQNLTHAKKKSTKSDIELYLKIFEGVFRHLVFWLFSDMFLLTGFFWQVSSDTFLLTRFFWQTKLN